MTDPFDIECDRLSSAIDAVQFERLRWGRTEGPMLERLVGLARSAIEERPDFELSEESSTAACRRLVLKVHEFRVMALNIALDAREVTVWGAAIERGKGQVVDASRRSADYADVDAAWMKNAIRGVLSEVR